jgi:hypothetical protein
MISKQTLKAPKSLFGFTLREKDLSLPEKEGILRLGLGESNGLYEEQGKEEEDQFTHFRLRISDCGF